VGDPAAELGLGGEMLRQMDRIAVAADLGKANHVRRFDDLGIGLDHPDRQVLEIERSRRRHDHARQLRRFR
jgi:hypothetical protein